MHVRLENHLQSASRGPLLTASRRQWDPAAGGDTRKPAALKPCGREVTLRAHGVVPATIARTGGRTQRARDLGCALGHANADVWTASGNHFRAHRQGRG